jgi:hypothetical protein
LVTASYLNGNIRDAGNFLLSVPAALLRQSVAQSIPNGVWTPVTFDTEDLDRDSGHSTVTNTGRYTAQTPGFYLFLYTVGFALNTSGRRQVRMRANGADAIVTAIGQDTRTALASWETSANGCGFAYLNGSSDYVETIGFQDSGGALNTFVASYGSPRMQCLWISS